jgi:hypothetical protein
VLPIPSEHALSKLLGMRRCGAQAEVINQLGFDAMGDISLRHTGSEPTENGQETVVLVPRPAWSLGYAYRVPLVEEEPELSLSHLELVRMTPRSVR